MFHFNYVEREFKMCKCLPVQFTRLAFSLLTIWNNFLTIWNILSFENMEQFSFDNMGQFSFSNMENSLLTIWNNFLLTKWNSSNAILSVETPQGSLGMSSALKFTFDSEIFSEIQVNSVCNDVILVIKAL